VREQCCQRDGSYRARHCAVTPITSLYQKEDRESKRFYSGRTPLQDLRCAEEDQTKSTRSAFAYKVPATATSTNTVKVSAINALMPK
jgi:hypothetical protein